MTVSFSSPKAGITMGKSIKGSWKSFNYEGLLGVDVSANLNIDISAAAEGSSCPGKGV